MKQFENIFRTFFLLLLLAAVSPLQAEEEPPYEVPADSIEVGLITCSPHEEVYSLYGHTALRYHNLRTGEDVVFNYGVFNFKRPHFVLRFVFGLTDYELGVAPTKPFLEYYEGWGSQVVEQVLNLTPAEKQRLLDALRLNYRPENRVYRYNYFYDNCSTRPRNIIERSLDGRVDYAPTRPLSLTYRQMVHAMNAGHPWAAFGNDLLLGLRADRPTTQREQEFLPDNLRHDFDGATVVRNGERLPLVSHYRTLVRPGVQLVEEAFPLSPLGCGLLLLAVTVLVLAYEHKVKKTQRWFDVLLMLAAGLAGCVLFAMIFSQHPTTSLNLQILILNPLSLFFIPAVARGRRTRWFWVSLVLTAAFLVGGLWQSYAEGMYFVALSLLLRDLRHLYGK